MYNVFKLFVDVVQMIEFNRCLVGKMCPGALREYLNEGSMSNETYINSRRFETSTTLHQARPRGIAKEMDSNEQ